MAERTMILTGDAVVTMDPENRVIVDGAIAIEDGRIVGVGTLDAMTAAFPALPVKTVKNTVLMPGLVNAHAHSGFLRGTAEHLPETDPLGQVAELQFRCQDST